MELVKENITSIKDLCKTHNASRLYVFGSVMNKNFGSESDVDMAISFQKIDEKKYADNYFKMKYALEKLLKRKVDLLEEKAIKNPYFKQSFNSTKKLIYEKN